MRILLSILCCFVFTVSFACDCVSVKVSKEEADKSDLIFTGKVVAVSGCSDNAKVKFMITKLFKGKAYESSEIEFDCQSDCAMNFNPDEEWIIYCDYVAYGMGKVEMCSLSRMRPAPGTTDMYSSQHGMTFDEELKFLENTFGIQKFTVAKIEDQQHHENLHPTPWQTIFLLIGSMAGLAFFYYLVKRFLK